MAARAGILPTYLLVTIGWLAVCSGLSVTDMLEIGSRAVFPPGYYNFSAIYTTSLALTSTSSNSSQLFSRHGIGTFPITIITNGYGFDVWNGLSNGFVDMWLLAQAAIDSISACTGQESSSFLRYFSLNDRDIVISVFQKILSSFREEQQNIQNPNFRNNFALYFNYGEPVIPDWEPEEDDGSGLECGIASYMLGMGYSPMQGYSSEFMGPTASDPNDLRYETVVCPDGLAHDRFLANFDCGAVAAAGYRMSLDNVKILGATLLHEMTHWCRVIGLDASGYLSCFGQSETGENIGIIDWNQRVQDPDLEPPNGYGPYNAMLVNKLHVEGAINADNYAWFALEARLLEQCGFTTAGGPLTGLYDPLPD